MGRYNHGMRTTLLIIAGALIVLAGSWWYYTALNIDVARNQAPQPQAASSRGGHEEIPPEPATASQGASIGIENIVTFQCEGGRNIVAVFARDIVGLTLSDGRQLELRQATSDRGVVYLNNTQTIELRGGDGPASLIENGRATHVGCNVAE